MSDYELNQITETVDAIMAKAAQPQMCGDSKGLVDEVALNLLSEAGLVRVAVPASAGGSEGDPTYLSVLLKRLGYHAANVGLMEDHLAAELLAPHLADVPQGMMTIASRSDLTIIQSSGSTVVTGSCQHVPWARTASHVLASAKSDVGQLLVALPVAVASLTEGHNIANEPRDQLRFDAVTPLITVEDTDSVAELLSRVLVYRSLALLGAGEKALDLTMAHVTDRSQFGAALSRKQVVQHYIAEMFGALKSTRAACDAATTAFADGCNLTAFAAALATRIEADRMSSTVARLSHQLHGAIGFTQEHPLHFSTKRLMAWRQDDLNETNCAVELARLVPRIGGPWGALTNFSRGSQGMKT